MQLMKSVKRCQYSDIHLLRLKPLRLPIGAAAGVVSSDVIKIALFPDDVGLVGTPEPDGNELSIDIAGVVVDVVVVAAGVVIDDNIGDVGTVVDEGCWKTVDPTELMLVFKTVPKSVLTSELVGVDEAKGTAIVREIQ